MEHPGRGTVQFQSFRFGTSRGLILPRSCVSTLWPRPVDMATHDASNTAVHASLPVNRFPHPFLLVPDDFDNANGVPWPLRLDDAQDVWFRYALRNACDLQLMALRCAIMGRKRWQELVMNENNDDDDDDGHGNRAEENNNNINDNYNNNNNSLLEKCKASISNTFKQHNNDIEELFDYTLTELRANCDYASSSSTANGRGFGRACVDGVWQSYDNIAIIQLKLQRDLRHALDKLEASRDRVGRPPTQILRKSGNLPDGHAECPGRQSNGDQRWERRYSERHGQVQMNTWGRGAVGQSSLQNRKTNTTMVINHIIDPYLFPYTHRKTAVLPPRPPISPPPPIHSSSSSSVSSSPNSSSSANISSDVPWELTRANCLQRQNTGVVAQPDEHLYFADGLDFAAREQFRSTRYQLLPAVVAVDRNGKCRFETYVNDLNPETFADVYEVLEKLLQRLLPMFQHVLADLLVPLWRPTGVNVEREAELEEEGQQEEEESVVGNEEEEEQVDRVNRTGSNGSRNEGDEAPTCNAKKKNNHVDNQEIETNNDNDATVGRTSLPSEREKAPPCSSAAAAAPTTTTTTTTTATGTLCFQQASNHSQQKTSPSSSNLLRRTPPNAFTTHNRPNSSNSTPRQNNEQSFDNRSTHNNNVGRVRYVRRRLRAAGFDIRETMGAGALTEAEVREALRRALTRLAMDEDAFERCWTGNGNPNGSMAANGNEDENDSEEARKRTVREIVNALLNHGSAQLRELLREDGMEEKEEEMEQGKEKFKKKEKGPEQEIEYWCTKKTNESEEGEDVMHANHDHIDIPAMHTTVGAFNPHEERPEYKAALQYVGSVLYGRTLQVIVEVSSMTSLRSQNSDTSISTASHLTHPRKTSSDLDGTETWHVTGCDNERIVATGLCSYYTTAGVSASTTAPANSTDAPKLEFRRAVNRVNCYLYGDSVERRALFGLGPDDCANQYCGSVAMADDDDEMVCVAFPNVLQHRMRPVDSGRTGEGGGVWKFVKFHLVDPVPAQSRRLSTACVPPQDPSWQAGTGNESQLGMEEKTEENAIGEETVDQSAQKEAYSDRNMMSQAAAHTSGPSAQHAAEQDNDKANETNRAIEMNRNRESTEKEHGVQAKIRAFEALDLEQGCRRAQQQPPQQQQQQRGNNNGSSRMTKRSGSGSATNGGIRVERRKMEQLMNEKVFERVFAQALPPGLGDDE